jgi:transposase
MEEKPENKYVRRSCKNYSMSFKLQVVEEIERGFLSITEAKTKYGIQSYATPLRWLRKYGNFDWESKIPSNMPKTQDQKIMELEQKVKLLEKQKAFLEMQVETSDKKAVIFDMMITLAEEEYKIPIRKKCSPEQSTSTGKKLKRR